MAAGLHAAQAGQPSTTSAHRRALKVLLERARRQVGQPSTTSAHRRALKVEAVGRRAPVPRPFNDIGSQESTESYGADNHSYRWINLQRHRLTGEH